MGLLCMDDYLDERISPVKLIYWPDEATQIPAHWHTNMELNFIASGAMTLLENGRELRMEAGAFNSSVAPCFFTICSISISTCFLAS